MLLFALIVLAYTEKNYLRLIALNEDQKSELTHIEPYLKAWGESVVSARTQASLDLNDLSRKLGVSKNQLVAIEMGLMKPFHNAFFYLQALKKYQTLLNIELTPDPKTVVIQSDRKLKNQNLKDSGAKLSHLQTSKISYQTSHRFKKKTIQFALLGVLLIVILVITVVLLRAPSEMIQNNVARLNAEVVSEPISSTLTSPTISSQGLNPSANETITSATPLAQLSEIQQLNQPTQPSPLNQSPQPAQPPRSQPLTQPSVGNVSSSTTPPTSTRSTDANQVVPPTATNMLSISFTDACWVQAIDKNGAKVEKIFNAGTRFEQPINNIKSLVIGNASAAKAMLGNKMIDLGIYKNPQSSTARLFEKDFASMQ